jgi:hypothetical protein
MARGGGIKIAGPEAVLVALLASGRSQTEAAREAKIPLRTVQRRCADPDFREEVARVRAEFLDRALGRLTDAATGAAEGLADLLSNRSPWVRLNASRALLEHVTRLREHLVFAERIASMEATLAAMKTAGGRL